MPLLKRMPWMPVHQPGLDYEPAGGRSTISPCANDAFAGGTGHADEMSNSDEGREMDTADGANVAGHRTDVYRDATEAASAERREIRAEIAQLEARVLSLQARDTTLEVLVSALRALLPASPEVTLRYMPTFAGADAAAEFPHRSGVDPESRHDAALGMR